MKNFLYLVQGEAKLVKEYLHLAERKNATAIFLTYDKPLKEAIFFPNSTWAKGRNKMLEIALKKDDYLYYIFCDDDISFKKGGWKEFEKSLLTLKPAIAIPIFLEKTKKSPLYWLKYNSFLYNDEQMMAFHKKVIQDCIVLPYQSHFDDIHWWASCEIQQILIQNFYYSNSIQFNNIQISNKCRKRYPNTVKGRNTFKKLIRNWLTNQFQGNYKDINKSVRKNLFLILLRTFKFAIHTHIDSGTQNYSIDENVMRKTFIKNSDLLNQFLNKKIISDIS